MADDDSISRSSGSLSTSVLHRARCGDQNAFRRMVELFSPLVYFWCHACGLSHSDVEDVSQQTFLNIYGSLNQFQRNTPHQSFRAWIRSITRSRITDHWRSVAMEPPTERESDGAINLRDWPESIDEEEQLKFETKLLFEKAVKLIQQEFSQRDFQVIWKVAVDGQSARDVAIELGISPNAVHIINSRIRSRVRQEFGDLIDND